MRPDRSSRVLLAITRSKAKMYEYGLAESEHIRVSRDPARLLRLTIGMLGDLAGTASRNGADAARAKELALSLRFAARYFDAYAASRLAASRDAHLLLLASAAYYLCDLPGSASVLVSRIRPHELDLESGGLDRLLWWLLRGDYALGLPSTGISRHGDGVRRIADDLRAFYSSGADEDGVLRAAGQLRERAYIAGTPRELLFADTCCAIVNRRVEYSARRSLPEFSGLPMGVWEPALRKESFVRELWPAQRLLGQQGVFAGKSGVVQMPTSAGKSRATEIIIRSAFLAGRASLAVVVGPFRALCHEIRESLDRAFRGEDVSVHELTDVLQADFSISEVAGGRSIQVMTPEKLVYVLRHAPELAARIGVLVLDEGHQFDAGPRGVTYELLVTSLKGMIPADSQRVLISAVITNASEINQWLNGDAGVVVAGPDLLPTERSIAFASWTTEAGQLHFVSPEDPDTDEFFVPRVIRSSSLHLRPMERTPRGFPAKGNSQSVALYLALRMCRQGAAAIFCGRKDTASGIGEMLVDAVERGLAIPMPVTLSDARETRRLAHIYEQNLGKSAVAARAAILGAFTHHGNTPHGVRLAVEHAIKEGHGRFVICTSTLAQGVNLPIRYLIVTTSRQGGEKIKVRDFHNLMGRAGRSGMHTEGSVIFADTGVYDARESQGSAWQDVKVLLRASNSEPCASSLLSILDPLRSDGGKVSMPIDPLKLVRAYVTDSHGTGSWIDEWSSQLATKWFKKDTLRLQLQERRRSLAAVESFLLAHWQEAESGQSVSGGSSAGLADRTLAYHLATPEQCAQLTSVVDILTENIVTRVAEPQKRRVFGRTLYGVGDTLGLERWVIENAEGIAACDSQAELLSLVWQCIASRIENETFKKWGPKHSTVVFTQGWVAGESFGVLHDRMLADQARIGLGPSPRKPKVEQIVEMGENALGFDAAHIIGAITEIFELLHPGDPTPVLSLQRLQKRMKYGLPSASSIILYEMGFADRTVALSLARLVPETSSRTDMQVALRMERRSVEAVLNEYPGYFAQVFERCVL